MTAALPEARRLGPRLWQVTDRQGRRYSLRPIRPDDAPALIAAFDAQSPEDRRMRVRGVLKRLPERMARAFCTVDDTRDVALVLVPEDAPGTLAGGARVMRDREGTAGEYAVSMASAMKGRGLGRLVLGIALGVAAETGMTRVWGLVDRKNDGMRALARRLGMAERADPDDHGGVVTEMALPAP
jgi:acetyltransferase